MNHRTHCPSCRYRLSPLALECPVCGLELARQALPKPLLFQASALQTRPVQESRKVVISAPALGRVAPLKMPESEHTAETQLIPPVAEEHRAMLEPGPGSESMSGSDPHPVPESTNESFWPLVRLEVTEAGLLLGLNAFLALVVSLQAGSSIPRLYSELWHFLIPVHIAISWALEMVPITLAGHTPVMGRLGLLVDSTQPERRIAFSLFHLISVVLFPISFFCMILTPYHRTLAEILTGQEILARPLPRMR